MKQLLFFLLLPFLGISQVQIAADIDGEAAEDRCGYAVDLSSNGSVVAVGCRLNDSAGNKAGHVRVYENTNGTWTQIGTNINGNAAGDESGFAVSLSSDGSIVAIGAPKNDDNGNEAGQVRVYKNISGIWTQIGDPINGKAVGNFNGNAVSLSSNGNIIAIGASRNHDGGAFAGHVRVFENISGVWTQIGASILGEAGSDRSGTSVSLSDDGTVVAIGATGNDSNGANSGQVRVYKNINNVWTQIGTDIDGEAAYDQSGSAVSLSSNGSIVAVGALGNDGNGLSAGHVRIYENTGGTWSQIGADIDGEAMDDFSGVANVSLSSDGSIVAIGAGGNDGNGGSSGHVRIYQNINAVWTQVGTDIDGEATGDQSGFSVSISSDGLVVAIGANRNDGNGLNAGHVRVYDLSGITLSLNQFKPEHFNISPNPTTEIINIDLSYDAILQQVYIYNSTGQLLKKTNKSTIDLSHFSPGVYFLEIETNIGKAPKKVIVK